MVVAAIKHINGRLVVAFDFVQIIVGAIRRVKIWQFGQVQCAGQSGAVNLEVSERIAVRQAVNLGQLAAAVDSNCVQTGAAGHIKMLQIVAIKGASCQFFQIYAALDSECIQFAAIRRVEMLQTGAIFGINQFEFATIIKP